MGKPVSDRFLGKALSVVADTPEVPTSLEGRVLGAIEKKAASYRRPAFSGRRILRFFGDAPPALAAAAVLLLLFAPVLVFRVRAPGPLSLAIRSVDKAFGDARADLDAGAVLKGRGKLSTGAGGHITLAGGSALILHLFEKSDLGINDSGRILGLRLEKGAIYLSRSRPMPGKEPRLFLSDMEIRLAGTRLYAEYLDDASFRLICDEGLLEMRFTGTGGEPILRIGSGRYADIGDGGRVIGQGGNDLLPRGYRDMFDRLEPLSREGQAGIDAAQASLPYRIEPDGPQVTEFGPSSTPEDVEEKAEYAVRDLGRLASFAPETAQRNFGRTFSLDGELHIALYDGLYRIGAAGWERRLPLARAPAAAPLILQDGLAVFFQDGLALYSRSLKLTGETTYPDKGSMQSGYGPIACGDSFLLPLQGAGLYRYLPASRKLEAAEKSLFPSRPLAIADGYLSGSYYRNAYALYDAKGVKLWEYTLPGRSYVDPVSIGKEIILYDEDDSGQRLIVLDASGKEARKIALPEPLVSDMSVYPPCLLVVSTKGTLFRVDVRSGKAASVKRLYPEALTSGQWRNLLLTVDSGRLATLTAQGEFELFSLPGMESLLKVQLPSGAPFDLQPVADGKRYFALNREGRVFALDWLED